MATLKHWIGAFRLHTLPLALSAGLLGSFLAYSDGDFEWKVLVLTLLTTLFLQILSNLANDYGDTEKGTDNEHRVGPQRAMQTGAVSKKEMKRMIIVFVILSLISGSTLIYIGFLGAGLIPFLVFFGMGLLAIFAAIKYTIGKRPYGYTGLGDIMVFIFFGIVGVLGTYYLHRQIVDWSILLPASSIGLFSAGVLNLNNLRDRDNDKDSGKITLVVRLGFDKAKLYHLGLLFVGFVLSLLYVLLHFDNVFQFLFVLTLPLFVSDGLKVMRSTMPEELYPELKKLAISTLLFSLTLGIGLIL